MGTSSKKLFIVLGVVTVAYAGYYFFTQRATLEPQIDDSALQQILNRTQAFIEYRQTLDQVTFDFSLFEDDRFRTLRSYSEPVQPKVEGRPDPFAPVGSGGSSVTSS